MKSREFRVSRQFLSVWKSFHNQLVHNIQRPCSTNASQSGTGGAPKYGTVSQLPLVGKIPNPLSNITVGRAVPDQGSVGYYQAQTSQNVVVEMTASSRAGIYQYTFPTSRTENNVLIDMSHVLPSFRGQGLGQGYAGGQFTLMPDGHYEASGTYNNGWNRSPDWIIYSC